MIPPSSGQNRRYRRESEFSRAKNTQLTTARVLLLTEILALQCCYDRLYVFLSVRKRVLIRLGHRNVAKIFIQLKQWFPRGLEKQRKNWKGLADHFPMFSQVRVEDIYLQECNIKTSFNYTLLIGTK